MIVSRWSWRVSEVFVSTDARHACHHSVIGSTMGRIPEVQVRIPSKGMGTFFPHTVSSTFRLSLTHTHTHTHTHTPKRTNARTHRAQLCFGSNIASTAAQNVLKRSSFDNLSKTEYMTTHGDEAKIVCYSEFLAYAIMRRTSVKLRKSSDL